MAYIEVRSQDKRLFIRSQAFCCDIHDTWENRKVLYVIFRALCCPETGKPLFTYQALADAFGYADRRNIHNFLREYGQCHENLFEYLRRHRKVAPHVVAAVEQELRENVLIKPGRLRERVNQRLGRHDLTSANIRAALEQIPCTVIRQRVLRELEQGAFHPKEEHVLAELFAVLEQDDKVKKGVQMRSFSPLEVSVKNQEREQEPEKDQTKDGEREDGCVHEASENGAPLPVFEAGAARSAGNSEEAGHAERGIRDAELVAAAGIQAVREEPDDAVIQKLQADSVPQLLTAHVPISDLPEPVVRMVTAATMYYSNASLSRIGRWFGGKAKTTIYNWIIGLALALWPVIRGWLWQHVRGTRVYIDEKWLHIRKKWYYWFVAVDQERGLPLFSDLLPTRSKWACRLFLVKLKRLGKAPSTIMTDGLKGYLSAIDKVFPRAKHLLCLFHHQQTVTRCVKQHFPEADQEAAAEAKKRMKKVVQSDDTRTIKRRLDAVEQRAGQQGWKIMNWIKQTRHILPKLLPAVRSNTYPRTTNEIERFFREFNRFYKTRCGFHSVTSARRELIFFLVVYLFTIQAERGKAPIEKILPEAKDMPFYHLLNYPFAGGMTSDRPYHVKPQEEMATKSLEKAA